MGGRIAFEAPAWLWGVPLGVLLIWTVAWRWPPGRGRRGWLMPGLRALLLAGMFAAAARPVHLTNEAAVSAVALLDVSASVPDAEIERSRTLVRSLVAAARPPHQLRLVAFAARPHELSFGDGTGADPAVLIARPARESALATEIASALDFAAALADPRWTRRVLLVSDGRPTGGDAVAEAVHLRDLGVRVDHVALATAATATVDAAVEGIVVTGPVAPHATFPLRIQLVADHPARIRLRLTRDGEPVAAPGDNPEAGAQARGQSDGEGWRLVAIPAGRTEISWPARLDHLGAPTLFAAEVRLATGRDAHPENDRALLAVTAQAAPRVVVLAPAPADAAAFNSALRAQSFDVQVAQGGRAIGEALARPALAQADLVVLCDLPRAAVGDRDIAAIERYVRDGGGLLITGGPHSFGPGGWSGTRLEGLLPVRLDAPQRRDEATLALALVIDRSGSMSGPKMELTKQAARGTADMLPVDDQIAVIAFDSQASTIVPLQRAANRLRIGADIGRIQPTGGTNILAGLREAVDQLTAARAQKKHAILLSDGQSATEGIMELVDAAAAAHITISTVGVGDGVDEVLMQQIARQGGGRYYHTRDPASIPRIFTRETSEVASSAIVERPTVVALRKRVAMMAGIPWSGSPRLRGYIRTHQRAQTETLLSTGDGDPLLARWSVGLGQVLTWTSDLGPRWADAWTQWPPFAQLWGQLARGTMRPRAAHRFALATRAQDGMVEVSVEATGSDDTFLPGLEGAVEITEVASDGRVDGGKAARTVPLHETAPGQYEGSFPIAAAAGDRAAALLLRASLRQDGRPVADAVGQLSVPLAPELMPAAAHGPEGASHGAMLLDEIANATGGGALTAPENLFRGAEPRQRAQPLRAPLLGILAMLFVAEIVVRRMSARAVVGKPGQAVSTRSPGPPAAG